MLKDERESGDGCTLVPDLQVDFLLHVSTVFVLYVGCTATAWLSFNIVTPKSSF